MRTLIFRSFLTLTFIFTISALATVNSNAQDCDADFTIYGPNLASSGQVDFGNQVYKAGDVDNDGHPDILVAADGGIGDNSVANVYSGLTGALIGSYFDDYNSIQGAGGFGYFDDDEYADILVNGVIFSGFTGDTLADYSDIARTGVSATDLNGDGKFDIIVADRNWNSTDGRVVIISGANGDTLRIWTGGTGSAEWFGHSVAVTDDMDDDGYSDIIIGAPKYDNNGTDKGRVFIYSGNKGSRLVRRIGPYAGKQFGYRVAAAGDLNNDGIPDFIVAGHNLNTSSAVSVWAYSSVGSAGSLMYTVRGGVSGDQYGDALDGIGDVNGDGYDDFAVGAFRYNWSSSSIRNRGNVYIYSGRNGSLLQETYHSRTPMQKLGTSICGLGDVDGDGTPDFAVGATWGKADGDPSNEYRGAVYVYKCRLETGIDDEISNVQPTDFSLDQNYPNPFNPSTVISYSIPVKSNVTIAIYNVLGQRVRVFEQGQQSAGNYKVEWSADGENGEAVASGVYFYKLTAGDVVVTKKMTLLK